MAFARREVVKSSFRIYDFNGDHTNMKPAESRRIRNNTMKRIRPYLECKEEKL